MQPLTLPVSALLAPFHYADATHLLFTNGSHDAAWAIESLLHVFDTRSALVEIHRVLKPGSPFAVSDMILRAADQAPHEHSSIKPLNTLLGLLEDSGFTVDKVRDLDKHLDRSLRRLSTDLDRHHDELLAHSAEAVNALSRVLHKTIPGIGAVFGYTVITARAARLTL